MDHSTDWELSKENFQPLRSGRKASALQQRGQKELQDEKQEYEMKLRTNDGPDPLELWHEYITWTEQNFPKGGKDANLHTLLEKCITQFKEDTKSCQDPRYLDVWVKYASMKERPLDIYQFMHGHGQCTSLPEFYVAWSWELEQVGKVKEAEMNFRTALDLIGNDPSHPKYEGVESKHRQFQARVMKRVVDGDDGPMDQEVDQRTALGSLRGHGRTGRVGSMRVGSAKKSDRPGVLPLGPTAAAAGPAQNSENPGFQIYQDDNDNSHQNDQFAAPGGAGRKIDSKSLPFRKNTDVENDPNADKWSKANVGSKKHAVSLDKIKSAPSFAVHQDEDVQQPSATPHKLKPGERSNVLTAKRPPKDEGPDIPLALFEPFDPTKKAMYAKQLVYQGTTELSFEELRAARYWKRVEEERLKQKQVELERMMHEIKEERDRMARDQELWRQQQQAEIQQRMAREQELWRQQQQAELLQQREEMMRWQKEEMKKMMAEQLAQQQQLGHPQQQQQTTLSSRGGSVSQKSSSLLLETAAALLQTNPLGGASGSCSNSLNSSHKTPPRCSDQQKSWPHPSPTVNTKEAYNIAQAMWGCSVQKEEAPTGRRKRLEPTPFDVYEDAGGIAEPAAPPFTVFQDEPTAAAKPFQVFEDEPAAQPSDKPAKQQDPQPVMAPPVVVEDQENRAVQEERSGPAVPTFPGEQTIGIPSMEDFAEMARAASTPFHGRRFVPEEDENTCAVQIVFKKPEPPRMSGVGGAVSPPVEQTETAPPQPPAVSVEASTEEEQGDMKPAAAAELSFVPRRQQVPMSPIMETSREHNYRSSSSSSNSSQSQWGLTGLGSESHWGNNTEHVAAAGAQQLASTAAGQQLASSVLSSRTPGLASASAAAKAESLMHSGYMADASSARTPGDFLKKALDDKAAGLGKINPAVGGGGVSRPLSQSPATLSKQAPSKRPKIHYMAADEEDDDEPTLDIMADFKKNAGISSPDSSSMGFQLNPPAANKNLSPMKNSFLQHSLHASYLEPQSGVKRHDRSMAAAAADPHQLVSPVLEASQFGCDVSSAGGAGPTLDMTEEDMAAPSLNLTEATAEVSKSLAPSINVTPPTKGEASRVADISQKVERISISGFDYSRSPFSGELHGKLLETVTEFPVESRHGYHAVASRLPAVKSGQPVSIGPYEFIVQECKGEGAFGKVFSAIKPDLSNPNETIANMDIVLKVQKPKNVWEFYIASELHRRLDDERDHQFFMSIPRCFAYDDGSIFVSERHAYSLLDVCNKVPQLDGQAVREVLASFFGIELLTIIEKLHAAHIIHGDIKPDNFLVQRVPTVNVNAANASEMFRGISPALILIDFGISLDMTLLPPGAEFEMAFENKANRTTEMIEGKKWSYQIDYFGVASIVYTILFGNYMKMNKNGDGLYMPQGQMKRWWSANVWNSFFKDFLNIESSSNLPDLAAQRGKFEELLYKKHKTNFNQVASTLQLGMRRK